VRSGRRLDFLVLFYQEKSTKKILDAMTAVCNSTSKKLLTQTVET
jgi:hypothetical protein